MDEGRGSVHIVHPDISDPARLRAHCVRVSWQVYEATYLGISKSEQAIGRTWHRHILRAPANHARVKSLGTLFIGRNQFVPNETTMVTGHSCLLFELAMNRGGTRKMT